MSDEEATLGRVFISHSYADAEHVQRLLQSLPPLAEPVVFPPIVAPPDAMVSTELINAITGCDSLIYIDGGQSSRSVWVAFERDYALRLNKQAYSYNIATSTIERDNSSPLNLVFYPMSMPSDQPRMHAISGFMLDQRHFDVSMVVEHIQMTFVLLDDSANVSNFIKEEILDNGGYVLIFWSSTVQKEMLEGNTKEALTFLRWIDIARATLIQQQLLDERLLVIQVDDCPPHPILTQTPGMKLFGDSELSWAHYVDQLVVYLYWVVASKNYPNT